MNKNHSLLKFMGVSSSEVDHLVETARNAGAFGAKLSGGGRGGNIIALAHDSQLHHITDELKLAGAVQTLIALIK